MTIVVGAWNEGQPLGFEVAADMGRALLPGDAK